MIKHPGARTRVLYKWEAEVLHFDKRNYRFDVKGAQSFAFDFWRMEGRLNEKCPKVEFIKVGEISFCEGRDRIVLHHFDVGPVILVHELVHAKGFGSLKNPHTVSFVRDYIRCLARFVGYSLKDLTASAMMRGLL